MSAEQQTKEVANYHLDRCKELVNEGHWGKIGLHLKYLAHLDILAERAYPNPMIVLPDDYDVEMKGGDSHSH